MNEYYWKFCILNVFEYVLVFDFISSKAHKTRKEGRKFNVLGKFQKEDEIKEAETILLLL